MKTEVTIEAVKSIGCTGCIFDKVDDYGYGCGVKTIQEALLKNNGLPDCEDGYIYKIKEVEKDV